MANLKNIPENLQCKICNRQSFEKFIDFEKYPGTISNLFKNPKSAKNDIQKIEFVKCMYCHHIQISKDMPLSFYEDYVMTVSFSKKMNDFQIEQARFFVDKFHLENCKVLEVGCGDGNFSTILKNLNVNVFCNEPSIPFRALAIEKGLSVDGSFIDDNYQNSESPFDAVISREVLEHVQNPIDFLINIRKLLKPEGVVLIEVPNFDKALQELRYYDMFPDHLSYFTRESLLAAMLISGFKNVEIFYGMDDEFIYATAQNKTINNLDLINAHQQIQNDFNTLFESYKNIVIWGAGGKGIATIGSLNNSSKIKYVVDSDPFKQSKFLPASGIIVKSPDVLFSDTEVDVLVITNLAYTDEILNILKENNFNKTVKILSKDGITGI